MDIHIEINTDNAAFDDLESEVARILREMADKMEHSGIQPRKLRDINGNRVGELMVRIREED